MYFPDRAVKDFDLSSKQAAILVTILGATHLLARLICGLFGGQDQSDSTKQIIFATSALIAGLANCVSVWFNTMALQSVYIVVFGLTSGK